MDTKSKKFNSGILFAVIFALLISGSAITFAYGIDKIQNVYEKDRDVITVNQVVFDYIGFSEMDILLGTPLLESEGFLGMTYSDLMVLCNAYASPSQEDRSNYTIDRLDYTGASYYIGTPKDHFTNMDVGKDDLSIDPLIASMTLKSYYFRDKTDEYGNRITTFEPEHSFNYYPDETVLQGEDVQIYLSYSDKNIEDLANLLSDLHDASINTFLLAFALALAALVLLIVLILGTCRKRKSADLTRKTYAWDKVFIEIQLAILIASILGIYGIGIMMYQDMANLFKSNLLIAAFSLGVFACTSVAISTLLSCVRIIRSRMLLKRSLILRPIAAFLKIIKSGFDGSNPFAKTLLLEGLLGFFTVIFTAQVANSVYSPTSWFLLFLTIALVVVLTCTRLTKYAKLRKGINEISSGNLSYKINPSDSDHSDFAQMSRLIDEIGSAQNIALNNELKNTRMKTELISNVSHDLRTPLTSIITYTDLLKTEGLTSENAEDYLEIIDEKSRRLQKLTDDLFEAAKASSGAINVNKEKVDLLALINQGLAEINGGFEEKELKLILNAANEHYYVEADGQLLWRVVDNLLSNVRKYALPGSRIYIDIKENDGSLARQTSLEVKNVSASQLNIEADELMERFMRGDEARATDGSGLGLAIARDLVNLQGGYFNIVIDGDLFKAVTILRTL